MNAITELVPVYKVLLVFIITVVLQQRFKSIGGAFIAGSLILQFWFPADWGVYLTTVVSSVFSAQTLSLVLIIIMIVSLSHSLKITGHFDKIVSTIRDYLAGDRKSVFMLPALVGLLPMPGGAIFSAPMVDEVSKSSDLSLQRKAASNHWFRHVWEYTWPLYPGVLLTASLTGLSLSKLVLVQLPLTITAIAAGFLFIARKQHFSETRNQRTEKVSFRELNITLFPITAVVLCFIATRILLSVWEFVIKKSITPWVHALPGAELISFSLPSFAENLLLLFSISSGLAFLLFTYPDLTLPGAFKNKRLPSLVFMIVSLLLFQDVLKSSGAVGQITEAFVTLRLPLFLLSAVLPFIVGLVTGITVGFVAGAFPILIPLIMGADPTRMAAYVVLGYGFGFMGVMLSPMHVCLVLTAKHFTVSMGKTIRILLLPAVTVMITACAVAAALLLVF